MNELMDMMQSINNVALTGMKSGQEIGFRDGILRAIAICEARSKLHEQYLPSNFNHKDGDHDQAATCGRRDECMALAYEIKKELA